MMWKYGYGQYIPDLLDMIVTSGQITDQYKEGNVQIPNTLSDKVLFLPENFPAKTTYYYLYGLLSMKYVPYNRNIINLNNNVCVREVNVDTSSWGSLSQGFRNCYFLTKINEGNIVDCSGITVNGNISNTFYGCSSLEEVSLINIPERAIDCNSLFSLAPNIIPDKMKKITFSPKVKVTRIILGFNGRYSLQTIVGELDFSECEPGQQQNPFNGCASLIEVRFTPESIKQNLSFTQSSQLSDESIQSILDGLANVSTTQTLSLNSAVYAKLTEEQKQSATDKGWTITG